MSFFSFRLELLNTLYDYYYTKQLDAFFNWVKLIEHTPTERIYIDLPPHDYLCDFKRNNKSPVTEKYAQEQINDISFILCTRNAFDTTLQKLSHKNKPNGADWVNIFQSPVLEIWENASGYSLENKPLRFGLSDSEKSVLLNTARAELTQQLNPSEQNRCQLNETVLPRLNMVATVDVALWVNGELRGSIIIENKPLIEAIKKAAVLAASDGRFKPVSFEELNVARIETAVMHDLRIPLQFIEVEKNEIYPEKGYFMHINNKKGWFVPAVFNCFNFQILDDLLKILLTQKMGLNMTHKQNLIFVFEVNNFIESTIRTPLALRGPIIIQSVPTPDRILRLSMAIADRAVLYLSKIQEHDGNIPPIINVLSGKVTQIDWVRLAHTTWALMLYGTETKNEVSTASALKAYSYIRQYIFSHRSMPNLTRCLTLVYFINTALFLEKEDDVQQGIKFITDTLPNLQYEPILFSQIASCLLTYSKKYPAYQTQAMNLIIIVQTDFNDQRIAGSKISLAAYAELMLLLQTLGNTLNDISYIDQAQEIARWYSMQQFPNGSFPSFPHSMYTYTRGTGKIFETLVAVPHANEWSRENIISWFNDMQYSEENSYFVKKEIKEKIIGGFRHDDTNQDVWIDSASHFLIGIARLIEQKRESGLSATY